ncbi:MAG: TRAP transporter large permease [Synergistaceae bacterium]|nr:TRAP transporter large permease [Synergistaceae bacterium]MBQ3448778.1 TRAP transporter large permease [Synergistaceae bacterium]MBQ3693158.1 TRAP transporter large permease [Synergistaceae bacterium]MBQ6111126.1 TRAP transporter large permease [Synergistaceae bacterium]MBR0250306.1 TRAP transporter large permease [Synergistaceae bacterium]
MPVTAAIVLFISFFVMLFAGVPISAGIGIASVIAACVSGVTTLEGFAFTAAQKCFSGLDSFSLLALPFFSLGGNIMNKGGIARRLVRLARLLVGGIPGYLAATNVLANMFFGAVSGSSVAATSAMGSILSPLEKDEGYDPDYSAAVNICSAPTGILIPPSGPLILYSITAGGVSVAALFMGGYFVGAILGVAVAIMAIFLAMRLGYKKSEVKEEDSALKIWIDAIPSLLAVIIVMGGILWGIFTATEAGVVMCLYCGLLAAFYREMDLKTLYNLLADTMKSSATILFLIAASSIMAYVMARTGIPNAISRMIMGVSNDRYVILLIMNVFLLVMGMFLDLTPAVLIFVPIFLPIARRIGMSDVHFGLMLIMNLGIGSVTPPVGSCLFVGCGVANVKIEGVTKYIVPIFITMFISLLLVTYIPQIALSLPYWSGLIKSMGWLR